MPIQPAKPPLCAFLYPPVRSRPVGLLRFPSWRCASRARQTPKMRYRSMNEENIPNDIGLLDGTFVLPHKPSLISSPAMRIKLYGHRLFRFYEAVRMMLAYKWVTGKKARPKLAWMGLRKTAQDLHEILYTALARRDHNTLQKICAEGLYGDLQERIAQQQNEYRWTRHKVRLPRVVSTRAVTLPIPQSAIRQHVIKIQSVQSLDPPSNEDEHSEDGFTGGEKKRMVEYLVLQRRIFKGIEGPWLVWGTVQETEASSVLRDSSRKGPAPIIDVVKAT